MRADRALCCLGALSGLLGVVLAAAAAHAPGLGPLETASRFLMIHAPALLALPALASAGLLRPAAARGAGALLALGLLLFCGDLAARSLAGLALLPWAAPAGGVLLMAGWALAGAAALLPAPA